MRLNPLAAALCGLALLVASHAAEGTFAASPGFSGKAGQTCTACHHPASPTNDDAKAILTGLPTDWDLDHAYALTIKVTGGPPAMPSPQPQGGFDIASDGGSFSLRQEDGGKLRTVGSPPQEVTYRPDGTYQREWQVQWSSPTLAQRPAPATFWLAVLAANGNHVVATNTTDQGETLDSSDHLSITVPPSAAALKAWAALPLLPPTASLASDASNQDAATVQGRHADANATKVAWSLDGGPWQQRATGPQWTLRFEGLAAGAHDLAYRSASDERSSADQTLLFRVDLDSGQATPVTTTAPSPAPAAPLLLLVLLATTALARSRNPA